MNPFDVEEMNRRIHERSQAATMEPALPIRGPSWAGRMIDRGTELVAIHRVTASPYPVDLLELEPEEVAVVLVRRILAAGGSAPEAERLIDAMTLPSSAARRLKARLADEVIV
jgi:hypothetical protein